jgi:hypothetical protein
VKTIINRYATPLTTGLFVVSLISGVALFFHWQGGVFHSMHTWLSMVLLLPFVLHVWKNWNGFMSYFKRKTMWVPLIASLVVAVPFAVNGLSGSRGGNPAFRTVALMTQARITDLAPVLKTTPDALVSKLKQGGYAVASADETLSAVAAKSGKRANELLFAMFPAGGRTR